MMTKKFIITSSGLKNIVLNKYQDDDFAFIFGEQEIRMKSFFAEFLSPIVSRLHQTDPTINTINFRELNTNNVCNFCEFSKTILSPEIISLIIQISSGSSIEINEEQAIKLRFLSIILGNEEIYNKLNEYFPPNYNEENVNSYLKNIECCYNFSLFKTDFNFNSLLSFVSSHFDQLDKDHFLNLPRNLQYEIISHPKLQIENEDSLFDIIFEIIERKKENEEIDDALFLEQIEFTELSEDRLRTFVDSFDVNEMSAPLWNKLVKCFFNHSERECKPEIIVGGYNKYNQLGVHSNNKNEDGKPIVSSPLKSSLDPSSLLSYTVICYDSVLVKNDGTMLGIGNNSEGRICDSLAKTTIDQFTEFSITDENGVKLTPISAACNLTSTIYMFSKSSGSGRLLAYCNIDINGGKPIFLDIGNRQPVSLFSGYYASAISSDGEVILIGISVGNFPESLVKVVSLPDGEKASSVANLLGKIFVLSSTGKLFFALAESGINDLTFAKVDELADEEIIYLSGLEEHCLAVSKDGRVFGIGLNNDGQLGLGEETKSVAQFTEITAL